MLQSGEWERGKFDFDHHFAFLTNFLKIYNFLLDGIIFGSSRGSFSKKNCLKRTFPSDLFIFCRKNGGLFVCFICSNFVRFWLNIEALIELRKMLLRQKLFDVRFGNCSTPKVPRFCRFTKMQLT